MMYLSTAVSDVGGCVLVKGPLLASARGRACALVHVIVIKDESSALHCTHSEHLSL